MKYLFDMLVLLLLSSMGFAQFEVQGIIRPRAEYRNGYKILRDSSTHPAYFISQRTRLSFSYKTDKLKTKISFYDARAWGDQLLKKDLATIGLLEGWAEVDLSSDVSIKLGRQMLKYDNSRLMSPVNWNQIGAAHDAVVVKFRPKSWEIDLGFAFSQSDQNLFGTDVSALINNYKNLNFLWISKKIKHFTLSSFTIADGYQSHENENIMYMRYTPGFILKYNDDRFDLAGRAFYQGGKDNNGLDLSAYYLNFEAGAQLSSSFKPIAGIEVKSGNPVNDSLSKTDKAFNILYGGRHKFNGHMDYLSVPSTTLGAGLINPYLKMQWIVNPRLKLTAAWHYFKLQGNYVYHSAKIDKYLGQEIDVNAYLKISEYIKIEGGYSVMFAAESTAIIKGGDSKKFNSWAYVMLTIDPVFYKGN